MQVIAEVSDPARSDLTLGEVYLVTDDVGSGANPDLYGVFSSRESAQAWIDRQKARGYPWWNGLVIQPMTLDETRDLMLPGRRRK